MWQDADNECVIWMLPGVKLEKWDWKDMKAVCRKENAWTKNAQ